MPSIRKLSLTKNSDLQQKFIVDNAFKRNKGYFNYQRIRKVQQEYETSRRRPHSSSQNSVDDKINSSFMNTTATFSDKVEHQIGKFKLRMSGISEQGDYIMPDNIKSQRSYTPQGQRYLGTCSSRSLKCQGSNIKKIRGMALEKYCSRQQYYRSRNKLVVDERLFNNYSLQKPDTTHTKDFDKCLTRDLDFSLGNLHDIQYNTQKLYEDYYYKKTTMQCNLNYKRQKITQRQIATTKRPEDMPLTELSPQKIKESFQKCSMLVPKTVECFYENSGRQLPCQVEMRLNTNLTNHWVDNRGKVIRKTKEYSLRKMKNDLVQTKMEQLQSKKKPKFSRDDLCVQKYFRIHSKI